MKKPLTLAAVALALTFSGCAATSGDVPTTDSDYQPPTEQEIYEADQSERGRLSVINVQLSDGSWVDCIFTETALTCPEFTHTSQKPVR